VETENFIRWKPTPEELLKAKEFGTGDVHIPPWVNLIEIATEIKVGQEVFVSESLFPPNSTQGYNLHKDIYFIGEQREPDNAIRLGEQLYLLLEGEEVGGLVLTHAGRVYDNANSPSDITK